MNEPRKFSREIYILPDQVINRAQNHFSWNRNKAETLDKYVVEKVIPSLMLLSVFFPSDVLFLAVEFSQCALLFVPHFCKIFC